MPNVHPFTKVAERSAKRVIEMEHQAEKSLIVPFGMQEVDNRTWKRRWDSAPPEMRRQMAEALGPDTRTRLQELAKRVKPANPDIVPFGGE